MAAVLTNSALQLNDVFGISPKSKDPVATSNVHANTPLRDRTNGSILQHISGQRSKPIASKSSFSITTALSGTDVSDAVTSSDSKTTTDVTPLSTIPSSASQLVQSQQPSDFLPPLSDPGDLLTTPPQQVSPGFARVGMAGNGDRPEDTPELPKGWSNQHDRAICYLDYRGYELEDAIVKLRNYFPELDGKLSTAMVDTRLRQLDQIVEITYWAEAMKHVEQANREESPRGTPVTNTPSNAAVQTASVPDLRANTLAAQQTITYKPSRSGFLPKTKMNSPELIAV